MVTVPVPVTFAANGTEAVQPGAASALTVIGAGQVTTGAGATAVAIALLVAGLPVVHDAILEVRTTVTTSPSANVLVV